MKNKIEEIYEEWSGESALANSCRNVHDSCETIEFAEYYYTEMIKNLKLIEAAPKMLECLIEMVTYLDKNELKAYIESKTIFEKIMQEIIEKATGISIEEV